MAPSSTGAGGARVRLVATISGTTAGDGLIRAIPLAVIGAPTSTSAVREVAFPRSTNDL